MQEKKKKKKDPKAEGAQQRKTNLEGKPQRKAMVWIRLERCGCSTLDGTKFHWVAPRLHLSRVTGLVGNTFYGIRAKDSGQGTMAQTDE